MAIAYKTIAATTCIKSPLEKEKSMMNVKQHTIAGPRSPSTKNNKIVVTIATTANIKNDNRLLNEGYSEINFSLVAKKPAKKKNDHIFYDLARLKSKKIYFNTTSFGAGTK